MTDAFGSNQATAAATCVIGMTCAATAASNNCSPIEIG
jgi:hypothetical protein